MPKRITMPALSPTMTEGTLSKWRKKEGDIIKSGDIIADIETDKAIIEYEYTEDGVLGKILIQEGTSGIKVNDVIGVLLEEGEIAKDLENFDSSPKKSIQTPPQSQVTTNTQQATIQSSTPQLTQKTQSKRIKISPLAKVIAKQKNIDYTNVIGSGPMGRIIKKDIENYSINPSIATQNTSTINNVISANMPYTEEKTTGIRKTIAKRLTESKQNIPHYYLSQDCNMDSLLKAREDVNLAGKDKYKISVNDFLIKALALTLRDVKEMNAYWQEDTIRYHQRSDIAVAVATKTGLFTPIVKDAANIGLVQMSNTVKDLAQKAKDGKLKPEEYQGGSFSISNLGMYGIKEFTAIINPPHSGILAVGATEKRAVVINNEIKIANMMTITLSADHRLVDGATAAIFMQKLKNYIENPVSMIL
jgi:pyruvate dehydrogenase E2 component (dihydrolipoamide acetyltransferase)